MKNLLLATFLISCFSLSAQDNPTCFQKYAKVFEVRGANPVPDGTYKEVIIAIRKGSFADCLMGMVKVKDGIIDPNSIAIAMVDDSFEPFRRSYKSDEPIKIINGMSKTLLTEDEELINILFVNAIKPKKKAFKKAPDPEFDL